MIQLRANYLAAPVGGQCQVVGDRVTAGWYPWADGKLFLCLFLQSVMMEAVVSNTSFKGKIASETLVIWMVTFPRKMLHYSSKLRNEMMARHCACLFLAAP